MGFIITIPLIIFQTTISKEDITTQVPRQHWEDCRDTPLRTKFIKYLKDSEEKSDAPKVRLLPPIPRFETVLQCFDVGRSLLTAKGVYLVDGLLGAMIGE